MDTSGRIPWAVLGIARDASLDDARRAFRQRAKALHPDLGGDGAAFATLVEAYRAVAAATPSPAAPVADGAAPAAGRGSPRLATPYDWAVRPSLAAPQVWAETAPLRVAHPSTPARQRSEEFAILFERELARLVDAA